MIKIFSAMPSFKAIDVLKIQNKKDKSAKMVIVLDEDIFMRSGLPNYSNVKILEGPYGHPHSGRPILPDASESAKEVCSQTKDADVDEVVENTKTITGFIKQFIIDALDLD